MKLSPMKLNVIVLIRYLLHRCRIFSLVCLLTVNGMLCVIVDALAIKAIVPEKVQHDVSANISAI